jgi:hypothetical protein
MHGAEDRYRHRNGGHDQRRVGGCRARDALDEEHLVDGITEETEEDEAREALPRNAHRRPQATKQQPDRQGGERKSDGVEGERIEIEEGALDDRVVEPPDDGHAEQDEMHTPGGRAARAHGHRAAGRSARVARTPERNNRTASHAS